MNKKILLRRPRCVINDCLNFEDAISKSDTRMTSFKDDIQPEIDQLDKDYTDLLSKIEKNEDDDFKMKNNEQVSKQMKINEFSIVSFSDINEGLIPIKQEFVKKEKQQYKQIKVSNKTSKEFEKLDHSSSKDKRLVHQNIYEQIEGQIPVPYKSIPKHIIIIQLAALLKYQLSNDSNKIVSCTVKSLSRKGRFPQSSNPKYEIILYENEELLKLKSITPNKISDILQKDLMNASAGGSIKQEIEDPYQEITPTKVSLMECVMTGRTHLNLSSHSISAIPNFVEVFQNLRILDLSYNRFKLIPEQIYQLHLLESLNLANNPLQIIDDSITNLNSLKSFICSFTLITSIPSGLFNCKNLEQADLSYNNINAIPHVDVHSNLKILNLSGNPIRYFKKSFTNLKLESIGLENTWIHPLFWREGEFSLDEFEYSWAFCDLCDQIISDRSINYISFTKKFNHIVPILMSFCSTLCRDSL